METTDPQTGAPALRKLARGRRDAMIVVSDLTRPVPNAALLPAILDALRAGGISPEAVTNMGATRRQRPKPPEYLKQTHVS